MKYSIEKASPNDKEAILRVMEPWNMHHVPSLEIKEIDLSCFFVAKILGKVVGASGYKILSPTDGKTTLLGVLPEFTGLDLGKDLQIIRLETMYKKGVKKVTTNTDRPEITLWYKKHFGYKQIGILKKLCSFGLTIVDHWTTLELDLEEYFINKNDNEDYKNQYKDLNEPPPLSPFDPLIINVCLTGMFPTKMSTPHVPITVEEIVSDGIKVFDAGAQVVHIHARDQNGQPSSDASIYERIIKGLRSERQGIICCATTSGRNCSNIEKRTEVLHLSGLAKPDMASLTLGSFNFFANPSINSISTIEQLAFLMKEKGIKPELEIFDYGMVNIAKYMERHKIIWGKKYFNILLGNLNTAPATLRSLTQIVDSLPSNSAWGATGLGHFQLPINTAAITASGHVRVGIEDSIYYDYDKNILATNENLVKRIVRISKELQRPLATTEQARRIIGLPPV